MSVLTKTFNWLLEISFSCLWWSFSQTRGSTNSPFNELGAHHNWSTKFALSAPPHSYIIDVCDAMMVIVVGKLKEFYWTRSKQLEARALVASVHWSRKCAASEYIYVCVIALYVPFPSAHTHTRFFRLNSNLCRSTLNTPYNLLTIAITCIYVHISTCVK